MSDWPWQHRPGAMTTGELTSAHDKLSGALVVAPAGDPGRAALEAQLEAVDKEQESRRRSELVSRGRAPQ
jgi:hypothetical protein